MTRPRVTRLHGSQTTNAVTNKKYTVWFYQMEFWYINIKVHFYSIIAYLTVCGANQLQILII